MTQEARVALVTGANRGIGLEVVRQLAQQGMRVILGARDAAKGEAAAQPLRRAGLAVYPHQLDVTDQQSIYRLHTAVTTNFGRLDILVNNAAILYDTWQQGITADLDTVHAAFETNVFGAWRMCQTFLPLLRRSRAGRIVNLSSEAGSLASMGGGTPAYSISKAALNALTRILAAELAGTGILVNAICLVNWVKIRTRGSQASICVRIFTQFTTYGAASRAVAQFWQGSQGSPLRFDERAPTTVPTACAALTSPAV